MSESSATEALSPEQPWPGPRSFSTTEEKFFFGRSADTDRLTELVLRSPAVLLYSQSGLGKSSLLAAGLMPQLQEMDHLVVPVRLDYKANAHPIGEQLLRDLVKVFKCANVQSRLPEEGESLWEFVHREDFACLTEDGRRLMPVFILDQFEEVFSLTNQSDENFWIKQMQTELEALLSHVVPAQIHPRLKALRKSGDRPRYDLQRISVKLVVGLREEYLPQMDSWSARLPALVAERYRLEPLSHEQAREIIFTEKRRYGTVESRMSNLVGHEAAELILEKVTRVQGQRHERVGRTGMIEPFLLSLTCYQLNKSRIADAEATITEARVEAEGDKILRSYYENAFAGGDPEKKIPWRKVQDWVETYLVTSKGQRGICHEESVISGIGEDALKVLRDHRLLRRFEREGGYFIELSHERLLDAAVESRQQRMSEEGLLQKLLEARTEFKARLSRALEGFRSIQLNLKPGDSQRILNELRELAAEWPDRQQIANAEIMDLFCSCFGLAVDALASMGRISDAAKALDMAAKLQLLDAESACGEGRASLMYARGIVAYETASFQEANASFNDVIAMWPHGHAPSESLIVLLAKTYIGLAEAALCRCLPQQGKQFLQKAQDVLPPWSELEPVDFYPVRSLLCASKYFAFAANEERKPISFEVERLLNRRKWLGAQDGTFAFSTAGLLLLQAQILLLFPNRPSDPEACADDLSAAENKASEAVDILDRLVESNPECYMWSLKSIDCQLNLHRIKIARQNVLGDKRNAKMEIRQFEDLVNACRVICKDEPSWMRAGGQQFLNPWHCGKALETVIDNGHLDAEAKIRTITEASAYFKGAEDLAIALCAQFPQCTAFVRSVSVCVEARADLNPNVVGVDDISRVLIILGSVTYDARQSSEIIKADIWAHRKLAALLTKDKPAQAIEHLRKVAQSYQQFALASTSKERMEAIKQLCATSEEIMTLQFASCEGKCNQVDYRSAVLFITDCIDSAWARLKEPGVSGELECLLREKARFGLETSLLRQNVIRLNERDALPEEPGKGLGLRVAEEMQNWSMPPLMPGIWRTLGSYEQECELSRLPNTLTETIGNSTVLRVRHLNLPFYEDGWLWEIEVKNTGHETGVVTYIRQRDAVVPIDGSLEPIYQLNSRTPLHLNSIDRATAYLTFFTNAQQTTHGRFSIILDGETIQWRDEADIGQKRDVARSIRPFIVIPAFDGGWVAKATVRSSNALYHCELRLQETGRAEVLKNSPFAADLPILIDFFRKGRRALLLDQIANFQLERAEATEK